MIAKLYALLGGAFDALAAVGALLVLVMTVVVSLDVALRTMVKGWGLAWSNDLCEYGIYLVTLLLAPRLLRLGQHVKVDTLSSQVTGTPGRILSRAVDVIGLAVSATVTVYGTITVHRSLVEGAMVYKNVEFPEWIALAPLPLTFALLSCEFALGMLHRPAEAAKVLT